MPLPYQKSCKIVARASESSSTRSISRRIPTTWQSQPGKRRRPTGNAARLAAASAELFGSAGRISAPSAAPAGVACTSHASRCRSLPDRLPRCSRRRQVAASSGLRIRRRPPWPGRHGTCLADHLGRPAASGRAVSGRRLLRVCLGTTGHTLVARRHAANTSYCYFPMPFDKSAKIELVSERAEGPPGGTSGGSNHGARAPAGRRRVRFHAVWRRENPTTKGQPFTFVDCEGRGHLVGCFLQAQGMVSGETPFFEGDDETTIDGETDHPRDRLRGLLQRWLVRRAGSLGEEPVVSAEWLPGLSEAAGTQWRLSSDARRRVCVSQEHSPDDRTCADRQRPGRGLRGSDVSVSRPSRPPWPVRYRRWPNARWSTRHASSSNRPGPCPIRSFTFRDATLTKMDEDIDGKKTSFLRMQIGSQRLVRRTVYRLRMRLAGRRANTV